MELCTKRFGCSDYPIQRLIVAQQSIYNVVRFVPRVPGSYANVFAKLYSVRMLLLRFISRLRRFRRRRAAVLIQSYWRFRIANPRYHVCRSRLLAEFATVLEL